jgi:hypothetical protein
MEATKLRNGLGAQHREPTKMFNFEQTNVPAVPDTTVHALPQVPARTSGIFQPSQGKSIGMIGRW